MISRQFGSAVVAATVCAVSLAGSAWACGDKLVALGGGVGFERLMVSRNPGHIVLLLEPGTGLTAANDKFNLAASLSLAGHEVFIAKSADELRARRDAAAPDLILVDFSRGKQIDIQPASSGAGPVILPVAYLADGSAVAAAYQPASCVTVVDDRKGAQVLKAVEHALKLRSRGQPMPCEKSADSQKA
jgi:hypothetical protein